MTNLSRLLPSGSLVNNLFSLQNTPQASGYRNVVSSISSSGISANYSRPPQTGDTMGGGRGGRSPHLGDGTIPVPIYVLSVRGETLIEEPITIYTILDIKRKLFRLAEENKIGFSGIYETLAHLENILLEFLVDSKVIVGPATRSEYYLGLFEIGSPLLQFVITNTPRPIGRN